MTELSRLLKSGILILVISMSTPIWGAETVGVRALQTGPIGDGIGFVETTKTKVELNYQSDKFQGRAKTTTTLFDGDARKTAYALGMVTPVNDNTNFFLFASQSTQDTEYESNTILPYRYHEASQFQEIGAGPVFRWGPLILGGAVSAVFFGEKEREVQLQGDSYTKTWGSATVPFMKVYGGLRAADFSAVMGVKVYNKTPVPVQSVDSNGVGFEEDGRQYRDGEIWVDSKITVFKDFDLGLSITAITDQGSPEVEEDAASLEKLGKSAWLKAENAHEKRNTNSYHLGFGGRYRAQPGFSLDSGIIYHQSRFAKAEYGSLLEQNMGGTEINVGVSSEWEDYYITAHGGYLVPEAIHYHVDDQSITPWAQAGDGVTVEQPRWSIQFGFGIRY